MKKILLILLLIPLFNFSQENKGKMEGTYLWFAGDSVTTELTLKTLELNVLDSKCLCKYDIYEISLTNVIGLFHDEFKVSSDFKTDTLIFVREDNKYFEYIKKK